MSRFNKNGENLSPEAEKDWLKANASPVEEKEKSTSKTKTTKKPTGRKQSLSPRTKKGDSDD